MNSGWTVYRNLSAHGAADLVAIRGKEIRMFDVKTVHQKRLPPAGSPISYILVKPDNSCEIIAGPAAAIGMAGAAQGIRAALTLHRRLQHIV